MIEEAHRLSAETDRCLSWACHLVIDIDFSQILKKRFFFNLSLMDAKKHTNIFREVCDISR